MTKKAEEVIPPIGDNIRIIPLGGVEEVGRNMTMIEYKDDIIVMILASSSKTKTLLVSTTYYLTQNI
jgi:mRNA degradation ribonuclease J1/J2